MTDIVFSSYFEQLIQRKNKATFTFLPITIHFFAVRLFASVVPNFWSLVVNRNLARGFVRFSDAHNKVVSSVVLINVVSGIYTIQNPKNNALIHVQCTLIFALVT